MEALLGWLRDNTWAPINQSKQKGKEVKVTGKKAEEPALQSYWGDSGQGKWFLFCFNHYVPGECMEVVLLGVDALVA